MTAPLPLLRRGTVALAVAALLVTAGCGGADDDVAGTGVDGTSASPSESPTTESSAPAESDAPSAGDSEGAEGSADDSDSGADGADEGGMAAGAAADGAALGKAIAAAQRAAGSYRFEMTVAVGGRSSQGHGEAAVAGGGRSDVHSVMETSGQRVEMIAVDGVYYMKTPMFQTDKWLRIDPKAKDGVGALLGQLGANSDPARSIGAVFEASKVRSVGTEGVDGVDTTRYHVVIPRAAIADSMGYPEQMAKLLPPKVEYDVYVDGDDLVRKLHSTSSVQGQKMSTDITFTDYGEPVDITAPPAGQVTTKSPLG